MIAEPYIGDIPLTVCHTMAYRRPSGLAYLHSGGSWKPYDHVRQIDNALVEMTLHEDLRRLMIFMSPQHGKSELTSRTFPAWHLGHCPDDKVGSISYGLDLAKESGFACRSIIDEHGWLFHSDRFPDGLRLHDRSKAVADWKIQNARGGMLCRGVGGGLTGRPCDVLLIDDPFKDWEEADSKRQRDKVYNWYLSVARTRLSKRGKIILIQTRWHDDDLAGRILNGRTADNWKVINIPGIIDEGKQEERACCPELHSLESLKEIRGEMGDYMFSCLYRQTPIDSKTKVFSRDLFAEKYIVESLPPMEAVLSVAGFDPSIGLTFKSDGQATVTISVYGDGIFYIEAHESRENTKEMARQMAEFLSSRRSKPVVLGIEELSKLNVANFADYRDFVRVIAAEMSKAGCPDTIICPVSPEGVKKKARIFRLQPLLTMNPKTKMHQVRFVDSPAMRILIDQAKEFPSTKVHDDLLDAWEIALRVYRKWWNKLKRKKKSGKR